MEEDAFEKKRVTDKVKTKAYSKALSIISGLHIL